MLLIRSPRWKKGILPETFFHHGNLPVYLGQGYLQRLTVHQRIVEHQIIGCCHEIEHVLPNFGRNHPAFLIPIQVFCMVGGFSVSCSQVAAHQLQLVCWFILYTNFFVIISSPVIELTETDVIWINLSKIIIILDFFFFIIRYLFTFVAIIFFCVLIFLKIRRPQP
jgi:hypothetical protein